MFNISAFFFPSCNEIVDGFPAAAELLRNLRSAPFRIFEESDGSDLVLLGQLAHSWSWSMFRDL